MSGAERDGAPTARHVARAVAVRDRAAAPATERSLTAADSGAGRAGPRPAFDRMPASRRQRTSGGDMKITPRKDGPLRVEGDNITLVDEAGNTYDLAGRTVVSLCRCGYSQNKAFWDGSHAQDRLRA